MLTRRGLGLVGLALSVVLIGFAYQVEEFVLVAVAAGVLLAAGEMVAFWARLRVRRRVRLEVGRLPDEVLVGDAVDIPLVVRASVGITGAALDLATSWSVSFPGLPGGHNRRRRSPDDGHDGSGDRKLRSRAAARLLAPPTLVRLPDLAGGSEWETGVALPTTRRGVWTMKPMQLWCTDPLGLVAFRATSSPPAHVVVCPDPTAVDPSVVPPSEPLRRAADLGVAGTQAGGDDLWGLRPYVPGDRLSRLHWPALNRSGELLVRHFVETLASRVELLVDVRPGSIEQSVQMVAARGVIATEAGESVVVRTTAGESLLVPAGASARRTLLHGLAVIEPVYGR